MLPLFCHGGLCVTPSPMANALAGTGAGGAALAPTVTLPAASCLLPGLPQELGLAEAARGISVAALQQQGREEQCVLAAAAHFPPLTPLDNIRLEDPGLPDISIAVPSAGSHHLQDSQMPKLYCRKWISSRKKKPHQNRNILMQHLTLLLLLQTPGRGIKKNLRLTAQHPSSLQPILRSAARYDRVTNGCDTSSSLPKRKTT